MLRAAAPAVLPIVGHARRVAHPTRHASGLHLRRRPVSLRLMVIGDAHEDAQRFVRRRLGRGRQQSGQEGDPKELAKCWIAMRMRLFEEVESIGIDRITEKRSMNTSSRTNGKVVTRRPRCSAP
jgi:hypothetical protein